MNFSVYAVNVSSKNALTHELKPLEVPFFSNDPRMQGAKFQASFFFIKALYEVNTSGLQLTLYKALVY